MNEILKTLILSFMIMPTVESEAQITSNKLEFGFNVSQYQNDFGIGLHVISPYFFNSIVALRLGSNVQWLEHYSGTEITWSPYQNFQLGIRARNWIVTDKILIYGEGGVLAILPNSVFSSENSVVGGYGIFGFEFRPYEKFAYFIELGGIGTGATADKIAGKPIYSNGFLTNVGFKIGI